MQLFKFMEVTDEELKSEYANFKDEYIGDVAAIGSLMKSRSGWPLVDGIDGNGIDVYTLSVLPGGYIDFETKEEFEVGQNAFLMSFLIAPSSKTPSGLRFEPAAFGVYKTLVGTKMTNIRCVKNLE